MGGSGASRQRCILDSLLAFLMILLRIEDCGEMAKKNTWHAETAKKAMAAIVGAPPEDVCVLDCRDFHPPSGQPKRVEHVGTHPDILEQVAEHRKCQEFMNFIAHMLHDAALDWRKYARRQPRRSVHIVMMCKSGKHRSVAMAWLLHRALQMGSSYALLEARPVCWTDLVAASACTRHGTLCEMCHWLSKGYWDMSVWLKAIQMWKKANA